MVYQHKSVALNCEMKFGLYIPEKALELMKQHEEKARDSKQPDPPTDSFPILYFLSGLTCTEQNFIQKSGFRGYAAKHGICVLNPDTSPRGVEIPGQDDSYDFGSGAGFYVDATTPGWSSHYKMYTYISQELPALVSRCFPFIDTKRQGIFGHSMGGHGALVLALRNPTLYRSVSAFAPICNPTVCPWGKKAFKGYLGDDKKEWEKYDACLLIKSYMDTKPKPTLDILIDVGNCDEYRDSQLMPDHFSDACEAVCARLIMRTQHGYNHSYFFIESFMGDHIAHHAKYLMKEEE